MISLLLRSMRCSQFAKYFAARTDSGTSDCLQAIFLQVGLGRVAQGAGLVESWPRLLVCVYAIYSRGIHVNVGGGLRPDFARIGVFLLRGTDRQVSEFPL